MEDESVEGMDQHMSAKNYLWAVHMASGKTTLSVVPGKTRMSMSRKQATRSRDYLHGVRCDEQEGTQRVT